MWWDAWLYECRGGDIRMGFVVSWLGWTHKGRAISEFQTSEFRFEEHASQISQPFYTGRPIDNNDGWTHGGRTMGGPMSVADCLCQFCPTRASKIAT